MELLDHYVPERHKIVTIAPIGDIQWVGNGNNVALEHLKDHIEECLARDALFLGMGDYIDFVSPSNRQRAKAATLYDNAEEEMDALGRSLVDRLLSAVLKPTTGRWLGALEGHHFWPLLDGTTTDQYLVAQIGAKHLGTSCKLELHFQDGKQTGSVMIWAHHGANNAVVDPLSQLERKVFPVWDADLLLIGHTPVISGRVKNKVYKQGRRLEHREVRLVSTGGWAKAYVEGSKHGRVPRGDYAEQAVLPPAALGAPIITITPRWKDGRWQPKIRIEL